MSWFEKNYEKAAIGGAAVAALGLAFLGWWQFQKVEADFDNSLAGKGNNDPAVKNADLIPKAIASMKFDRTIHQSEIDERKVDLFVGVPLYVGKADPTKAIDLFKSEPVHPPIPNIWWLENQLDAGFADSPQRDPDGDGFSNLQEFEAKTDPNDSKSHPSLVMKLKYINDESVKWQLRPGFESEGGFSFRYTDDKNGTASSGAEMVKPGTVFFAPGARITKNAENRFKLLSSEKRTIKNEKLGSEEEQTFVKIEDQRANKKGEIYELPAPLSESKANEHSKFDRTAVLSLEAIGQEGKEFKVEERTAFALPSDAAEKAYTVTEITPEAVSVEFTDAAGSKKTVKIPKGGFAE